MLAAKSFVATSDMAALERWLGILADELSDRMIYDSQVNQRFPRNLVLSYRCITSTDAPYPHAWSIGQLDTSHAHHQKHDVFSRRRQ